MWGEPTELEEGKWVWTAIITQYSTMHNYIRLPQPTVKINHPYGAVEEVKGEVEKALVVTGEEKRVVEAFRHLQVLLSS
ncbi:hypothetical protein SUGI_0960970 [Cryptomeria japonica]|nr:hypothetical protein SUGI_0960970 [Cryptomeria japonica]